MKNKEVLKKIASIVNDWIKRSGMTKKGIADKIQLESSSFIHMLKGRAPFPKNRLLQLVKILKPPAIDIQEINKLIYSEVKIFYIGQEDILIDQGLDFFVKEQQKKLIPGYPTFEELMMLAIGAYSSQDMKKFNFPEQFLLSLYGIIDEDRKKYLFNALKNEFYEDLLEWHKKNVKT